MTNTGVSNILWANVDYCMFVWWNRLSLLTHRENSPTIRDFTLYGSWEVHNFAPVT